jgi:murein DD-endopeptidase MepM/ murein hydrolase activator NlpD
MRPLPARGRGGEQGIGGAALGCVVLGVVLAGARSGGAERESPPSAAELLDQLPARYFLCERNATEFCQPIRTAFAEAATTHTGRLLRGKVAVQHLNGGYGVNMDVGGGRMLLHTGADLGWFDTGLPVFAMADGVVRRSSPGLRVQLAERGIKAAIRGPADYGNVIVIEHRIDGKAFCTLYGHLGDDRLVRQGDVVSAGQRIGSIGRKSPLVNGDYEPHLHFAVHEGAFVEPGTPLMRLQINGQPVDVTITELSETELTVTAAVDLSRTVVAFGPEAQFPLEPVEGSGYRLPARVAWLASSPNAGIPGYAPTLDGFRDPIGFLREQIALNREGSYFEVSSHRGLDVPSRVGRPAPSWEVDGWLNVSEDRAPTLERVRGRIACLFLVQVNCPGTKSHGWVAIQAVARRLEHDPDVALLALQTTFTLPARNNRANLERAVAAAGVTIPVGQMSKPSEEFLLGLGQRGTPWVVLLDQEGVIQFSNFLVRPEEIAARIDSLRKPR